MGLRSQTHVVLAGLKRSPNELAAYQKKLVKIDDHMGIGMSGLTADGRSLVKHMRTEALNHKYVYGTPIQGNRLVTDLADMHQRCTQSYVRRPYGVGLLVATYDQTGPHLYLTQPSGDFFEYSAMAIVSLAGEAELDVKSASIAVAGADTTFNILAGDKLQSYLDAVEQEGGVEPVAAEDVEMEEPEI